MPKMDSSLVSSNQKKFLVVIWPEDIEISLTPKDGFIQSKLYGQEYRGTDRIISLAVGDEHIKKMVAIDFPGRFGDECWFSYNKQNVFLFDSKTGDRIS
jgi:ABC-type sugar transport system ATPase subunit